MKTQRINHLAVWLTVILYQVFSAAWYGLFANTWMELNGFKVSDFDNAPLYPYFLAIGAAALTAYGIGWFMLQLKIDSAALGVQFAAFVWFCIVMPEVITKYSFSMHSIQAGILDEGITFINYVMIGGILGGWRKYSTSAKA